MESKKRLEIDRASRHSPAGVSCHRTPKLPTGKQDMLASKTLSAPIQTILGPSQPRGYPDRLRTCHSHVIWACDLQAFNSPLRGPAGRVVRWWIWGDAILELTLTSLIPYQKQRKNKTEYLQDGKQEWFFSPWEQHRVFPQVVSNYQVWPLLPSKWFSTRPPSTTSCLPTGTGVLKALRSQFFCICPSHHCLCSPRKIQEILKLPCLQYTRVISPHRSPIWHTTVLSGYSTRSFPSFLLGAFLVDSLSRSEILYLWTVTPLEMLMTLSQDD